MIETFDLVGLRSHFPALSEKMRGRDLVYFDNGATSLKPKEVVDALTAYYLEYSANIHRGVYEMSARATTEYDVAREAVRRMLGVTEGAGEVIFTRGTTESINLVAYAWGLNRLGPGDEILLTPMEHHSNLVPWQQIAKRTGATLRYIPLTGGG